MNRFLFGFVFFIALCCFAGNAFSKELIREFKGTGSKTTAEFEVTAPWIADWRTQGDYPGQMAVEVNLLTVAGEYVGKIVTTKYVDNGVKLFLEEGGTYRFRVDATLINTWTLRVEELTREEASQYKPKEPFQKQKR